MTPSLRVTLAVTTRASSARSPSVSGRPRRVRTVHGPSGDARFVRRSHGKWGLLWKPQCILGARQQSTGDGAVQARSFLRTTGGATAQPFTAPPPSSAIYHGPPATRIDSRHHHPLGSTPLAPFSNFAIVHRLSISPVRLFPRASATPHAGSRRLSDDRARPPSPFRTFLLPPPPSAPSLSILGEATASRAAGAGRRARTPTWASAARARAWRRPRRR